MRTAHDVMRARLLSRVIARAPERVSLDELRASEWSDEFERYMRNRLLVGAFRYGRLGANGKPAYRRVESIRKRLTLYERTGNLECLVDVANLSLCEFVEGRHPEAHWGPTDDGEHTASD